VSNVKPLAREILSSSGVDLTGCTECGACSRVCPVAAHMDLPPCDAIKEILSGSTERVLSSKAIWLCTSCYGCTTHCPEQIDFARVVDDLRARVIGERRPAGDKRVADSHLRFVARVRQRGRFFTRIGDLFDNFERGLALLLTGRFSIFARKVKDRRAIDEAFSKANEPRERGR
jgi:heterodisulfide reductase subunit C